MGYCIFLRILALALLSCLTIALPGCTIPLAVFPFPSTASGERVTFRDQHGRPLSADGLLIVCRTRLWVAMLANIPCTVEGEHSNRIVEIRKGQAKMPADLTLASIWVEFPPPVYWSYQPIVTQPDERVYLIPLVPGYRPSHFRSDLSKLCPYPSLNTLLTYSGGYPLTPHSRDQQALELTSNQTDTGNDDEACAYWQSVYECIRLPHQKRQYDFGPDLRLLRRSDYERVRHLIEAELERLAGKQVDTATTSPAGLDEPSSETGEQGG